MDIRILAAAALVFGGTSLAQVPAVEVRPAADWGLAAPFAAVKRLPDGGHEELVHQGQGTLTKKRMNANRVLVSTAVYRLNKQGKPLRGETFDATGKRILKSRFGYRKTDGKLVEEQVFDTVNPRKNRQGEEIPVRRIIFE